MSYRICIIKNSLSLGEIIGEWFFGLVGVCKVSFFDTSLLRIAYVDDFFISPRVIFGI